jgi:iron complex outermembrane receptor protein
MRVASGCIASTASVKGPASVLFGQGTIGGVVNLNSKLPEPVASREAFVEYGSFDRKQVGVDVTGPVDSDADLFYRFVGVFRDSETMVDYVDDDSFVLNPSFTWRPTDDTSLTVLANWQKDTGGTTSRFVPIVGSLLPTPSGDFITSGTFFGEPDFDKYNTEQKSITALFEHRFNDVFSIEARARYSDSNGDYDQIWPAFGAPYEADGQSVGRSLYSARNAAQVFVADTRINAAFATGALEHEVTAGVDYQDATTDSDVYFGYNILAPINLIDPAYGTPIPAFTRPNAPEQSTKQTGIYAFDRISFDDRLFVSLGLRHDTYRDAADTETRAWSGSAGILYKFDNGIAPYVSYADSFEPAAADFKGFTYDPIRGRQVEAGVKYQPPGTPHIFTAALFNIDQINRLQPNPLAGADEPVFVQTGETRIQGFEIEAQTRFADFELLAAYSHLDTEDRTTGFELASVPEHMASAWLTWRPQGERLKGWVAGIGLRYVGESLDGADNFVTPDYLLADLQIGYEAENWSAKLNVQNLTDETYLTTCLSRGDCFYGQRRSVNFRLTSKF